MKRRQERGKWKRGERQKEEEADEKAEEEERREKIKEGRRGRKEEEENKEKNRECDAKDAPPPPNAFPSQKLGNNMTPIKGRLGKNTTPTHGDLEKLIQRRQRNLSEDSRTSSILPCELHPPTMKNKISKSIGYRGNRTIIYKEAKAFGNLRNRSKFAINSH